MGAIFIYIYNIGAGLGLGAMIHHGRQRSSAAWGGGEGGAGGGGHTGDLVIAVENSLTSARSASESEDYYASSY
jgi:hypothetical protein